MKRCSTQAGAICLFLAAGALLTGMAMKPVQFPSFSETGPDAGAYGAAEHFPTGSGATAFEKKFMVGTFSHFDSLYPVDTILASAKRWEFQRPANLPDLTYYHAGSHYSIEDYLAHLPVTGLLIARDNEILFEAYQYGRTDRDQFTSQSMAKTVVGLLAGVAMSEHALHSTADVASQYVPELKGSDYGKVSIQDLLHMSSGVTCQSKEPPSEQIGIASLTRECRQEAPAGTRFRYSSTDAAVLGLIVERATHKSLASYLQGTIWQRIGTEAKATWTIDGAGGNVPYCCLNATLRDYARLGRLLAYDGNWSGTRIVPQQWLADATTVKEADAQLAPGKSVPFFGYGYQLWIFPGPRRMFGLLGANGQRIFVDPESKLVLVQTAVMEKEVDPQKDKETIGLWLSLVHRMKSAQ